MRSSWNILITVMLLFLTYEDGASQEGSISRVRNYNSFFPLNAGQTWKLINPYQPDFKLALSCVREFIDSGIHGIIMEEQYSNKERNGRREKWYYLFSDSNLISVLYPQIGNLPDETSIMSHK